jgi:diguanylate cyclase (GGDEF)-like protein
VSATESAAPPQARRLPRHLSEAEAALFARNGVGRDVRPGDVIFRRGELGRAMFVVEEGEVRLEFGDGLPDKIIGPREYFGELVLFIGSHTRVANAVAIGSVALRIVDQDAFDALVESDPAILAQFMRRSFSYLVASEQQLIQRLKRRNEDLMVTLDSLQHARSQLSVAQQLVSTDELSGLCNRRGLYRFLDQLEEQRLPGTVLALLLVDLDRFKLINDRHGHLVGDQVLRAIAEEVQNAASIADMPCRLGGDEFALLMQVTGEDELIARATQVVHAIRALRFPTGSGELTVTVSVGGRLCAADADWAAWYSDVDTALYQAKGRGGDGCCIAGNHV